ncbi:NAD(P)/FAD-dependent oxidoreductase [Mobilitalea sibirica]|uniref:NAD(P)/FAD-dependent oxidoreductase n=1 Tax=Mobilitalea sibirica TaxID=1462919 RepID=A0A8J7KW51_9FIRM|nr:FAD-dependent oxidoreductase [Mobilitalea sibirica]MBH1940945.1 NAD(P)/FAD-dependent oxidoreductase [Mobilitalea sibirica]
MKKVIIIGGGIAGLSAGIFAQKNGFDSIILEKHHTVGGECTGWDRNGYHVDGCIHWLVGTKEGTPMHKLWTKVGALDGVKVYHPETFLSFEHKEGTVHLYRDLERLRESWLALSPEDKAVIEEFYQGIKQLHSFEMPTDKPMDMMTLKEKIKLFSSMKAAGTIMSKYGKISLIQYANTFRHPALRDTLATFVPEGYSASSIFFALASFTKGDASIPYGGSKAMAMRMAMRYQSLGGRIETLSEVTQLESNKKSVSGVICKNGKSFNADYVIAACDAKVLFERLLKGKHPDPKFEKRFNDPINYPLASNIYIALGYEGELKDLQRSTRFAINPIIINNTPIKHLLVNHYQYEKDFAPEGHTVITCAINQYHDDYDAWKALASDPNAYRLEKDRIGREVIGAIEDHYPDMKGKIKLLDFATPITYERYCNAYRGAFMSFLPTIKGKMMAHTGRIKGLDNLYLSGQWLQPPGGLPVAVMTGKDTIMRICKKEKKEFHS